MSNELRKELYDLSRNCNDCDNLNLIMTPCKKDFSSLVPALLSNLNDDRRAVLFLLRCCSGDWVEQLRDLLIELLASKNKKQCQCAAYLIAREYYRNKNWDGLSQLTTCKLTPVRTGIQQALGSELYYIYFYRPRDYKALGNSVKALMATGKKSGDASKFYDSNLVPDIAKLNIVPLIGILKAGLSDKSTHVRRESVEAVREVAYWLKEDVMPLTQELESLLYDKNPKTLQYSLDIFKCQAKFGGDYKQVFQRTVELVSDSNGKVREEAMSTLCALARNGYFPFTNSHYLFDWLTKDDRFIKFLLPILITNLVPELSLDELNEFVCQIVEKIVDPIHKKHETFYSNALSIIASQDSEVKKLVINKLVQIGRTDITKKIK
jgi:hypothetical protein